MWGSFGEGKERKDLERRGRGLGVHLGCSCGWAVVWDSLLRGRGIREAGVCMGTCVYECVCNVAAGRQAMDRGKIEPVKWLREG